VYLPRHLRLDRFPYLLEFLLVFGLDPRGDFEIEDDDVVDSVEGGLVVVRDDLDVSEAVCVRSPVSGGQTNGWLELGLHINT